MLKWIVGIALFSEAISHEDSPFKCDWSRAKRGLVEVEALTGLQKDGFSVEATGVLKYMVPTSGDELAGNPNTIYGLAFFPGGARKGLVPKDYPIPPLPSQAGTSPFGPKLGGGLWYAMQRDEAIAVLLCTPPPARYFGLSTYVTSRILFNTTEVGDGDTSLVPHLPAAELHDPLNQLRIGTTAGPAPLGPEFFGSTTLLVWSPSRAVFERVADRFVAAGLPREAVNYYGISGQVARLHDRTQPAGWRYDFPDLLSIVSRVTYFENETEGRAWVNHTWPAFFLRAPADTQAKARYGHGDFVPEQRLRDDATGDSEHVLLPTMQKLMRAIAESKAAKGAELVTTEQLVPAPNDRSVRDGCLTNYTYMPLRSPFKGGGCGFGTRDSRYGYGNSLQGSPFGDGRFFVVVGVRHEALKHSSYSSVMLTSGAHIEEPNHTITLREHDGAAAPSHYLPEESEAELLYAVTLDRSCESDDPSCIAFTERQFKSNDTMFWLERAYLNPTTGVGPSIHEYVMSFVMVFQRRSGLAQQVE